MSIGETFTNFLFHTRFLLDEVFHWLDGKEISFSLSLSRLFSLCYSIMPIVFHLNITTHTHYFEFA